MSHDLAAKRLQMLSELVPGLSRVAILWNSQNPSSQIAMEPTLAAGQLLKIAVEPIALTSVDAFEAAFASIKTVGATAFIVTPDGMFFGQRARIAALAAAARLPGLFSEKEAAQAGGLISYGPSIPANFRRAAVFVDKILRGAKPADRPVEDPAKFELAINLKTAKALGLTIPPTLLGIADEVIEYAPAMSPSGTFETSGTSAPRSQ
jgi:putative tryptophan/tyrosine transport system substrate-binding protein